MDDQDKNLSDMVLNNETQPCLFDHIEQVLKNLIHRRRYLVLKDNKECTLPLMVCLFHVMNLHKMKTFSTTSM